MKIALVAESVDAARGGAETSTLEFARLLRDAGQEVHLVTAAGMTGETGLTQHAVGPVGSAKWNRLAEFLRNAERFLRDSAYDVVHAIAPLPNADVYQPRGGSVRETIEQNIALRDTAAGRAIKRLTVAMNAKQRMLLRLERGICRDGGPTIAAVSQYVAEQFARHYGLRPPRVRVVFNGVTWRETNDAQRAEDRARVRRDLQVGSQAPLMLCVAHNFKLKGVSRLIEALAILKRAGRGDVIAAVVGRDDARPYEAQARRLGVAEQVRFAGAVADITPFLNAADGCVHPTSYDPCSRIVLEALANGIPVVSTRQNGASEVVDEGRTGFVLDSYRDIDAMADRIRRIADGALRDFARAAMADLRQRVSMQRHVVEMVALYGGILDRTRVSNAS